MKMHSEMADCLECLRKGPADVVVSPTDIFVARDLRYCESQESKKTQSFHRTIEKFLSPQDEGWPVTE